MARKPKEKSHLPDKKHAPKKTGKRLPPPEDPEKNVETLTTVVTKQEDSPLLVEQPPKPKVVGDRFEVFYQKPKFDRVKGVLTVAMPFSAVLEKEHKELIPTMVAENYSLIRKKGRAGIKLEKVPGQRVEIYLSHDQKEPELFIPAARMVFCYLGSIQRKGEGVARKIIRWSFELKMPIPQQAKTDKLSYFAERNVLNTFWMKMETADPALFEGEEAEATEEEESGE